MITFQEMRVKSEHSDCMLPLLAQVDTIPITATEKHPALVGREAEARDTLSDPDEIRRSRKDSRVLLFYRGHKPRWICAVVRRDDGAGFLITVWTRSR
jgi:hypothetical protein